MKEKDLKEMEKTTLSELLSFLRTQEILDKGIIIGEETLNVEGVGIVTKERYKGGLIKKELYTDCQGNKFPSSVITVFLRLEGAKPKTPDEIPHFKFNTIPR